MVVNLKRRRDFEEGKQESLEIKSWLLKFHSFTRMKTNPMTLLSNVENYYSGLYSLIVLEPPFD